MKPGSRIAHFEVLSLIGAGGMGEVYRARDTRLGRDVAIKVLPVEFAADPERLRRFEQEARAVAALSHPHILALFDVGTHEGSPYLVTELLEGESLQDRLRSGALPVRKAVETAVQIAQGLAAAHEKGIVHRDLKPANVFLTKDGQVKILDFGLAKLAPPRSPEERAKATTVMEATDAGMVLGTVAYMSPEQVVGKPLDARSDLFSLGIVLYEMLSGKRPFQKETAPETMAAILREDPPDLVEIRKSIPQGLARIVRHCLEKEPSSRFQSARDVGFDLESLSQSTSASTAPLRAPGGKRRLAIVSLGIALLGACATGFFIWGKHAGQAPLPSFKRITFRRGTVWSARFTPDFQSVVYSASWEGRLAELFVQRLASADARPLLVTGAAILIAGTAGGDVAILRRESNLGGVSSTLTQIPLEGGTPRDLLKGIDQATWDRSGTRFVIVRAVMGRERLEYPVGNVLVETKGQERLYKPRLSPDGTRIAFYFQPNGLMDYSGDVCVVDQSGQMRTLSKGWPATGAWDGDLAWSPNGNEVWFSATRAGFSLGLHAVTLSGQERLVTRLPGNALLQDIAPDGRVLLKFGQATRRELRGRMAGDTAERDLSWLDGTFSPVLASDGTQMLFQEWGEGGGAEASAYHWRIGSPAPKRLGDGSPTGVSPDWATALVLTGVGEGMELKLIPIGAGETRTLPRGSIHSYDWALWHPDGKRIVIIGTDGEGKMHLFVQDLAGGLPRPFAQVEGHMWPWLPFSPDGRFVAAKRKESEPYALLSIGGGEMRPIPFLNADDIPLVFSDDGKSLFVTDNVGTIPRNVLRLDLETGRRDPWLELTPPDRAGALGIVGPWLTPNGRFYAYTCQRELSDLYLVEGLK